MAGEGWQATGIAGAWRRHLGAHPDPRGSFFELWRERWTADLATGATGDPGPVRMRQANLSRSAPGVLRGLHCHRRQADLWIVAEGHAFVALVDVRPAVDGDGPPVVVTFEADPGDAVFLPALVAHGFLARDEVTLVYLVTNEYDGSDELGFAWDDPQADVPWPMGQPILSARDAGARSLAALVEELRAGR